MAPLAGCYNLLAPGACGCTRWLGTSRRTRGWWTGAAPPLSPRMSSCHVGACRNASLRSCSMSVQWQVSACRPPAWARCRPASGTSGSASSRRWLPPGRRAAAPRLGGGPPGAAGAAAPGRRAKRGTAPLPHPLRSPADPSAFSRVRRGTSRTRWICSHSYLIVEGRIVPYKGSKTPGVDCPF